MTDQPVSLPEPDKIEQWFEAMYVCKDPDCTATHVHLSKITDLKVVFTEGGAES